MVTFGSNDAGGMARWKSRRGEPPSCSLARWIAAASGAVSAGCELPNDSAREGAPGVACRLAGPEFGYRLAGVLAELLAGNGPSCGADDAVSVR
jgi:hypothetical protein